MIHAPAATAAHPRVASNHARTLDEELLCAHGPGHPTRSTIDPRWVEGARRELAAGFAALEDVVDAVAVFGSAEAGPSDSSYVLARRIAAKLGQAGYAIMTGGGPGIMEAANRGARDVGALSIGLDVELVSARVPNPYIDRLVRFRHLYIRKLMFVRYASAFVVFPGGLDTIDELFEALSLIQHRKVRNFPVVLVGTGFWQGLVDWLEDRLVQGGKLARRDVGSLIVTNDTDEVVAHVSATTTPAPRPPTARP